MVAFPPGTAPDKEWIDVDDLDGVPLAVPRSGSASKRVTDELFERAGKKLHVSLESGDPYLIRCLASDGFGAAVLPASITRRPGPAVDTRPLRPGVCLPVYLIWREGATARRRRTRSSTSSATGTAERGAHQARGLPSGIRSLMSVASISSTGGGAVVAR